jgi:succinylglutamate desuccinylase
VLELTPSGKYTLSLLLSTGIHGNETAPVEIVDLLLRALYRGDITLQCRLLVVLGNPPALAQNKRYLVSDINRMFGGRWSQFRRVTKRCARSGWRRWWPRFLPPLGQTAGILICIRRSGVIPCTLWCFTAASSAVG